MPTSTPEPAITVNGAGWQDVDAYLAQLAEADRQRLARWLAMGRLILSK